MTRFDKIVTNAVCFCKHIKSDDELREMNHNLKSIISVYRLREDMVKLASNEMSRRAYLGKLREAGREMVLHLRKMKEREAEIKAKEAIEAPEKDQTSLAG